MPERKRSYPAKRQPISDSDSKPSRSSRAYSSRDSNSPSRSSSASSKRIPFLYGKSLDFNIELNAEQKEARRTILNNDVTLIRGRAGSGKTLVASYVAMEQLFKGEFNKIIIMRPPVAPERSNLGFMPGGLDEKMANWMIPLMHNLGNIYTDKSIIDGLIRDKKIEIYATQFMQGITFVNTIVIMDECQNLVDEDMISFISRIGVGSKIILCGDETQINLKHKEDSGIHYLSDLEVEGFGKIQLLKNHRLPIVERFLKAYNKIDDDGKIINIYNTESRIKEMKKNRKESETSKFDKLRPYLTIDELPE